nr:EOG090X0IKC [Sida crystallina]
MVKNKKSRGRKKYQYHVDRKKVNNKAKKLPNLNCPAIKKEWKNKISPGGNLKSMGLTYNTNKTFPIRANPEAEYPSDDKPQTKKACRVVEKLENEANAPRNGTMRIPGEKVKWIEYLLDKYGDDYEAMVRDKNNHYQETAAQLRQKIKQFIKRPAYLVPYLRKRGLISIGQPGPSEQDKPDVDVPKEDKE